ncbi:DNL-type zinc finger protein-like [Crassostrea angulata]|uniref:DNL-type zinc finger protein-like n=1 Tax=Magallana angulata TaxID=2784310 RepID=UPI0022B10377|nr:DNL-type zinc finger protein-like [Crassostrea angulata]
MNKRLLSSFSRAVFQRKHFSQQLCQTAVKSVSWSDKQRNDQRLRIPRTYTKTVSNRWMSTDNSNSDSNSTTPLGKLKQIMAIQFTCKVCDRRNSKTFSRTAYTKGIVIIKCDGCENNHLIADNLGWFQHVKGKNIEEILAEKGEEVKKQIEEGALEIDSKINICKDIKK